MDPNVYRRLDQIESKLERMSVRETPRVTKPKCIKTLGSPNHLLGVGNAGAQFPLNTNEVDNDGMGTVNGRITIQTPGRYAIVAFGYVFQASAVGNFGVYAYKNGGGINWNGAASAGDLTNAYTNTGTYSGSPSIIFDDLVSGDYITMFGYTWTAGITVGFHYNGSFLGAWMVS